MSTNSTQHSIRALIELRQIEKNAEKNLRKQYSRYCQYCRDNKSKSVLFEEFCMYIESRKLKDNKTRINHRASSIANNNVAF